MTNFNADNGINELKIEELDAIVGGGQCGGGVNWGHVGSIINRVNNGVGAVMSGGLAVCVATGYGAAGIAYD